MARWLLSGHNPRETFGVLYPISGSYFGEFMARRQYEYLLNALAGGTAEFDLSMPGMLTVEGYLYVSISSVMRNLALVLPADPTSLGAPRGLVTTDRKARWKTRLLLPFRIGRIYRETAHTYRVVVPRYRQALEKLYWELGTYAGEHPEGGLDLASVDPLFDAATITDAITFLNAYNITTALYIALARLVEQRVPEVLNLLVGQDTNTAQLGERMYELCRIAQRSGDVVALLRRGEMDLDAYGNLPTAAPLLQAIQRFLRTYGHRAFRYASQFEATRLADQPGLVLLTIAGLLNEAEPTANRAEVAQQVGRQALRKMNPLRRFLWGRLLRYGRALVERREENRDTLELQNATFGLAAGLLSRHYFPDQPSDHLWLYTFEELLEFGQSQGQRRVEAQEIERRRADLARHRQQTPPPELIWYDPETREWWPVQEAETCAADSDGRLQGIGASAGSGPVEGIALVTDSPQQAAERLLEIDGPVVLVTQVTDPVWSSLFRRLTAVVTEMGGVVSHAATVARENGIPAVVGVPGATQRVRDGQRVRVDGATGVVEVID